MRIIFIRGVVISKSARLFPWGSVPSMLVVTRFRVAESEGERFRAEVGQALTALAERPGYVDGTLGHNVDDPGLWVLMTRWESVGSYRRALSSYDVKVAAVPLLSRALDEPSAYQIVDPRTDLNIALPRSLG